MKKTIAEMEQTAASEAANKLISLFDEDSFVELGKFVGANGEKTYASGVNPAGAIQLDKNACRVG